MNIALNGPVAQTGVDIVRARLPDAEVVEIDHRLNDPQTLAALAAAEILVTVDFERGLPAMPQLRLIHVPAAGLDGLDLAAVPPGCRVCNVFEHETGISEYVFAAMLHWTVDLAGRNARFKAGTWRDSPRVSAPFRPELAGKTVGCIGYGHIGRAIAARARAFGMRVMAVTRSGAVADPAPDWHAATDDLAAVLEAADFVVVACPLNEATRGLLGRAELARMRPDAVLVNVARGPIVDEDALYDALRDQRIGGAVLDTWYRYPAPDDPAPRPSRRPFHDLANVVMTPHCSGWTEGLMPRRFAVIIDNIERLWDGRPLVNQVHPG